MYYTSSSIYWFIYVLLRFLNVLNVQQTFKEAYIKSICDLEDSATKKNFSTFSPKCDSIFPEDFLALNTMSLIELAQQVRILSKLK